MKTMTIYALMGKIYNNNQDVPKKIKYNNKIYEWKEYDCGYQEKKKINWVKKWGYVAEVDRTYFYLEHCFKDLHDEVDILDDEIETISNKTRYYFSAISNGMMKTDREALDSMFDTIYKKIDELSSTINEMKNGQN